MWQIRASGIDSHKEWRLLLTLLSIYNGRLQCDYEQFPSLVCWSMASERMQVYACCMHTRLPWLISVRHVFGTSSFLVPSMS